MSDRDRRLTMLMKKCWHEWNSQSSGMTCKHCGFRVAYHTSPPKNPDFSTGADKTALMDWAVEQGWWESFYWWVRQEAGWHDGLFPQSGAYVAYLWRNLSELLDEYHKEKVKK